MMGYVPYQLVQDFFHQQYFECGSAKRSTKKSTSNPICCILIFLSFEMIHELRETRFTRAMSKASNKRRQELAHLLENLGKLATFFNPFHQSVGFPSAVTCFKHKKNHISFFAIVLMFPMDFFSINHQF